MNKNIKDIHKKAYNLIIKQVELPFYNDLFMKYIIGKNKSITFDNKDEKLKIDIQYKKFVRYNSVNQEKIKFINDHINIYMLEKKKNNIVRQYIIENYSIYYNVRISLHMYDILKFLKINKIKFKKIRMIVFSVFMDNKIDDKYTSSINNIQKYFKINIDRTTYTYNDLKKEKDNINYDIIFIKFVTLADDLIINQKLCEFYNLVLDYEKDKTIIFETSYKYDVKLLVDIIQILSSLFENTYIYSTKYNSITYIVTIIFHKKKLTTNKFKKIKIKKNEYVSKLLYKNNKILQDFFSKLTNDFANELRIYLSILQMSYTKPLFYQQIKTKLDIYREFIKYEFDQKFKTKL